MTLDTLLEQLAQLPASARSASVDMVLDEDDLPSGVVLDVKDVAYAYGVVRIVVGWDDSARRGGTGDEL